MSGLRFLLRILHRFRHRIGQLHLVCLDKFHDLRDDHRGDDPGGGLLLQPCQHSLFQAFGHDLVVFELRVVDERVQGGGGHLAHDAHTDPLPEAHHQLVDIGSGGGEGDNMFRAWEHLVGCVGDLSGRVARPHEQRLLRVTRVVLGKTNCDLVLVLQRCRDHLLRLRDREVDDGGQYRVPSSARTYVGRRLPAELGRDACGQTL